MFRRTTTEDPTLTHLWRDDTHTECGLEGEMLPATGDAICGPCLDRYGADLAAAFSDLEWLGTIDSPIIHAFAPDVKPDDAGRIRPICHIRSYDPDRLDYRAYRMRCPHCLAHLRRRNEGHHG